MAEDEPQWVLRDWGRPEERWECQPRPAATSRPVVTWDPPALQPRYVAHEDRMVDHSQCCGDRPALDAARGES